VTGLPLALILLHFQLGAAAPRGTVTGKVKVIVDGAPRPDASGVIVYVTGFAEPPPRGVVPEIVQRDRQFQPSLLAVTSGQEVSFPNADPFFHNVFSVSPAYRFDLGQYRKGESKKRLFKELGPVEIYCNIHPEMAAKILVLPNRRFARSGADGSFTIEGVPAGTWDVYAFDLLSIAPERAQVTVTAGGSSQVELTVSQTRKSLAHKNKFGEDYREAGKAYP
jgi:plastocyanin